jgi:uncharacterized integral membrane protein
VGVVLLVVLVALVVDPTDNTNVGYDFGDVEAPLFVFLVLAALLGTLLGWMILHRPGRSRDT